MRTRYLLAALIVVGLALRIALPGSAGEAPSKVQIDRLIDQLGSGDFSEREKASKDLAAVGVPALDALRKAAKSEDAEVRKRVEEILPKIERQAESARVLAPKRVRLVCKEMPLPDAVADLRKQSGYTIELQDPDGKLKERKITLDTGDTTFWHALGLFCAKAQVREAGLEDLMQAMQPQPGGAPVPAAPGFIKPVAPAKGPVPAGKPAAAPAAPAVAQPAILLRQQERMARPGTAALNGQITLLDGQSKNLPTDDRTAVRIHVLPKSDLFGNAPEGEVILPLEVSPEPTLQWEGFQLIRITKAVDNRDQELAQVIPQVEGVAAGRAGVAPADADAIRRRMMMQRQMMMQMKMRRQGFGMTAIALSHQASVQLKKGDKEAKSLKELKGTITANLLTEAEPMIVAYNLKSGASYKGKQGGFIKILDVKSADEETTVRLEFEQPPFDKVMPAQQNFMNVFQGGGVAPMRIQAAPAAGKMPVPLGAVQGQIAVKGGMPFMGSFNGLSVLDDKGTMLPVQVQMENRFQQQPGGAFKQTTTYTLSCRREKDRRQPAKVVYLGRKRVTVDVPFAFTDVPLP
jgi:hypothetical protein